MKSATYAVVRYVPDPGRNEALNVGIVIWNHENYSVRIDPKAADRVVRESPWLEKDALMYLEPWLRDRIGRCDEFCAERVESLLEGHSGFPVWLTEPRFTSIDEGRPDGLDHTLGQLVARIVRPRGRRRGGDNDLKPSLERRLSSWIEANIVVKNFSFRGQKTRVPRTVDFYTNSNKCVAVDCLKLDLKNASEIRHRVDAEAYKAIDLDRSKFERFVVLCSFSEEEEFSDINDNARSILIGEGAEVFTDLDSTVELLRPDRSPGFVRNH